MITVLIVPEISTELYVKYQRGRNGTLYHKKAHSHVLKPFHVCMCIHVRACMCRLQKNNHDHKSVIAEIMLAAHISIFVAAMGDDCCASFSHSISLHEANIHQDMPLIV